MGGLALQLLARFGLLGLALIFAAMAWASWQSGNPPTASLLAPREMAEIVSTQVVSGRASNGSIRHEPVVTIRWPDEASPAQTLAGLKPSFFDYRDAAARSIVADYPVGMLTPVRIIDGAPVADRIDLFGMAHAVFLSVFAFSLLVPGLLVAFLGGRPQATR
jgi:hypothetical protein